MTISDILIIYFSFGAPFAVYEFIQERQTLTFRVAFITAFRFLFWLPLLAHLSFTKILKSAGRDDFAEIHDSDAELDKDIRNVQSAVADRFRLTARHISIHEFREILERYAGLSLLVKHQTSGAAKIDTGIFAAAGHKDPRLATVCIERRNRERLIRHHINARADFLKVIKECLFADEKMLPPVIRLTELLEDLPAMELLLADLRTRIFNITAISESGDDLWLPEIQPASKSERLTAVM
ncbi:MAG: hypothetical protein WKF92_00435 [Pyrinomonadaceae bacterium]